MFSKGLPLPFAAGRSVACEPAADVVGVDVRLDPSGVGAAGAAAEDTVAWLSTVDVTVAPVLMPVGPITIGTTTCSVLPSPSVVVLVIVVLIVLDNSALSPVAVVVCWVVREDLASEVVVGRSGASKSVPAAAA